MKYENYAFLKGDQETALISFNSTTEITKDGGSDQKVTVEVSKGKEIEFYPWGADNDMPNQLITNAFKNNIVASNLDFNSRIGYGDDVIPVKREVTESGELKYRPLLREEAPKIFDFLEENNYTYIQNEMIHDLSLLHNSFVEFIFNKNRTNIVQIRHKEASYSRLEVMDDDGVIKHHGYSADWSDTEKHLPVLTPLLDFANPIMDLLIRLGRVTGAEGRQKKTDDARFIMHVAPPSPGKFYYQKAYWWSIFESHWFDFSTAIPEFKMNLMKNQMVLKYHIQIRQGFFENIYKAEGITTPEDKTARRKLFLTEMEDFLTSKENAGKNLVSEIEYDQINKGIIKEDIKITPIESFIKGGEYIEDSEEASNAICYAMGVHPSLQGASPGKNKTINGTEARELFIIKQAMMAPIRKLLLQPLRLVKKINKWDPDIDFIIPNIMLTTLDKNTGAEKQIGNQIQ